jgi:uncharacterized protein YciI
MRLLIPVGLLLAACGGAPASTTAADPAAPPAVVEANPVEDVDAGEVEAPPGMDIYYLVLLQRGPRWTAEQTPEVQALGKAHLENIGRLAREGHLVVAGPFLRALGPDAFAGLFFFVADTEAQVRALVETDPAVKAGRFVPVILPVMLGAGLRTDPVDPVAAASGESPQPGCTSEVHGQLDFWLGEWQVTDAQGAVVGHNTITREQRGCVLVERWRAVRGGTGTSLTYHDPQRSAWVQHWVDGAGGVIDLEGGLRDGAMHLAGTYTRADGTVSRLRGVWTPLPEGRVRQQFDESTDGGATWKPWFDGVYQRP